MFNDLYEDLNFPDLFIDEPIVPGITSAEEEIIKILPSELKAINARIDRLEAALSTQTLRLELERAKRQKLRLLVKQRRPEVPVLHPEALRQLIEVNFAHQETINYHLGGRIDHLNTVAFRCFSRTQQLLSYILPCVTITPSDFPDVNCLLEEIGRTLQHLSVHQPTTPYI